MVACKLEISTFLDNIGLIQDVTWFLDFSIQAVDIIANAWTDRSAAGFGGEFHKEFWKAVQSIGGKCNNVRCSLKFLHFLSNFILQHSLFAVYFT